MMKRASVAVAMTKGKWEGSTNFREQLKDKEEAKPSNSLQSSERLKRVGH